MAEIRNEVKENVKIISVIGDIDAGSSIYLDNAINDALREGIKKIAINLNDLEYISSAGLGVFISHLEEFKNNEVKFVLFGIKDSVKQVFDILGLEKLLAIVKTEQQALDVVNE